MRGSRSSDPPSAANPPTHELLARARDGDADAANSLFSRFVPLLRRWAHGRIPARMRSGVDTGDLIQETVFRTFLRLPTLHSQQRGALFLYLRRAVMNRLRDQFRYVTRHPTASLDDTSVSPDLSPVAALIRREDRRRYLTALRRLREADRRAIVGRIEHDFTYEQLAVALDKPSAEAARLAVRRALVRLSQELGADR